MHVAVTLLLLSTTAWLHACIAIDAAPPFWNSTDVLPSVLQRRKLCSSVRLDCVDQCQSSKCYCEELAFRSEDGSISYCNCTYKKCFVLGEGDGGGASLFVVFLVFMGLFTLCAVCCMFWIIRQFCREFAEVQADERANRRVESTANNTNRIVQLSNRPIRIGNTTSERIAAREPDRSTRRQRSTPNNTNENVRPVLHPIEIGNDDLAIPEAQVREITAQSDQVLSLQRMPSVPSLPSRASSLYVTGDKDDHSYQH